MCLPRGRACTSSITTPRHDAADLMKEERPAEPQAAGPRDGSALESAARVEAMRAIVAAHLRGDRRARADVERLAVELAAVARREGHAPERLLIVIRKLWRDLGLPQADRLQAASLYELLVRRAIEEYYGDQS